MQDDSQDSKGGKFAAPDVQLEEKCPQCGNNLVLKQGRYGPFELTVPSEKVPDGKAAGLAVELQLKEGLWSFVGNRGSVGD